MRKVLLTFSLLLPAHLFSQSYFMIVGSYNEPGTDGIHVFRYDTATGRAIPVSKAASANPSFLCVAPGGNQIYAVYELAPKDGRGGDISAFHFSKSDGQLKPAGSSPSGGDHPCHVETDMTGRWIFAANYSSGSFSVLPVLEDGSTGTARTIRHTGSGPDSTRQKGPHVHGSVVSADNKYVLVTDLGTDKVMIYAFDEKTGALEPAKVPFVRSEPGAGPRQIIFHPNQRYAYLVEELSGTVVFFKYRDGQLKRMQRISTMAAGDHRFPGSADIHVSPDGKFLYASNRGEVNNIAIYRIRRNGKLKTRGHQPVLGKTPRYFSIDPGGKFLLCANQNSDEIVIFSRDNRSGLLKDTGGRIPVGKPVCIKWIPGSP